MLENLLKSHTPGRMGAAWKIRAMIHDAAILKSNLYVCAPAFLLVAFSCFIFIVAS